MEISHHDPNFKPVRPGEPDTELYTIPSDSSWFRWDDIHETERTALKEFFDGSSISRTPKIYKEYRDFMINKYREDPSRRLTFAQVRKSLVGDVSLLHKVFNFLDKWGLINFGAPPLVGGNTHPWVDKKLKYQVKVEEGAPNGIRVVAMPHSLKPIVVPPCGKDGSVGISEGGFKLPPLASFSDAFGDLVKLKGLKCESCGDRCDSECYQYSKGNFIICVKCFKNGKYGENKSMDDFKFNDGLGNSVTHGAAWTEAETLLLLESVMKHGDDWELVAQNVRTKSKLDCISRLIELPFGEYMMGTAHGTGSSSGLIGSMNSIKQGPLASSEHQDTAITEVQVHEKMNESEHNGDAASEEPPAKRKCIASLSDSGSSLLKQVALVSTMVGPHITSAAAEAAALALCDESSCPREMFDGDEDYQDDASEMKENPSQSETQETSQKKNDIPLTLQIRAATATALGAAAANAKLLADQEDKEIEHLVATVIETKLKELHLKMKYVEDVELLMEKEYIEMMGLKECIVEEQVDILQRAFNAGVSSKWRDHTYVKLQTGSIG